MVFKEVTNSYNFVPMSYKDVTKVVDDADFLPDSELIRALRVSGNSAGETPVYDYDDGKVPANDTVTPEVIALRSGKLDRCEVQVLKESLISQGKEVAKQAHQDAVDSAVSSFLGVNA